MTQRNEPANAMVAPSYTRARGMVDLAAITAADIDFREISETLAKTPRWGGRNFGPPVSVAEHCVLGTRALRAEGASRETQFAFLLHDAHEAFIGDIQAPVAQLLGRMVDGLLLLAGGGSFLHNLALIKRKIDRAIADAAGIVHAGDPFGAEIVKDMDMRMAETEARALFGSRVARANVRPAPVDIETWVWGQAADQWWNEFRRLAPREVLLTHIQKQENA